MLQAWTGRILIVMNCGQLLIERNGYGLGPIRIDENKKCPECGADIDIVV